MMLVQANETRMYRHIIIIDDGNIYSNARQSRHHDCLVITTV